MTAHASLLLGAGAIAGIVLGLAYFGGLWWTVRRLPSSRRPGLWITASVLLRLALLLPILYLLLQLGFAPFAATVGGFIVARIALSRWFHADTGGGRR